MNLEGFDEFWLIYPRKVAKEAARRMYRKALKLTTPAEILRGVQQYAAERKGADPKYTKHPATWLNSGCWNDEPASQGVYRNGNSLIGAFDRLQQYLESADDRSPGPDDLLRLSQG